ncbi:MAG TPA: hypothetical protein VGI76_10210 [Solirubrobacteraceae bacterium]|jgi:hypothetical protein
MADNAIHVTLTGDLTGEYLIEQELPHGRLLLRPNPTQVAASFPGRPATPEEYQQILGALPTDDEG